MVNLKFLESLGNFLLLTAERFRALKHAVFKRMALKTQISKKKATEKDSFEKNTLLI